MEKKEHTTSNPVGICEKLFNALSISPAVQTIRRISHPSPNSTATAEPNPSPPPQPNPPISGPATLEKPSPIKGSQFPEAPEKRKVSEVGPFKFDPPPRPPPQKSETPQLPIRENGQVAKVAPKIETTIPPVLVQEKEKLKPKAETAPPAKAVIGQDQQKVQEKEKPKAKVETAQSANAVFGQGQEKVGPKVEPTPRKGEEGKKTGPDNINDKVSGTKTKLRTTPSGYGGGGSIK